MTMGVMNPPADEFRHYFIRRNGWPAAALVLAVIAGVEADLYASEAAFAGPAVLFNVLVVFQLLIVRRYPGLAALFATLATTVILADQHMTLTTAGVVSLLTIDGLVVLRRGLRLAPLLALPLAINAISPLDGSSPRATAFGPLVLVVATVLVAEAMRQRGNAIQDRDASKQALTEAVREQAAMEERARIARELHDIVAHHLSVISVQAESARVTSPELSADGRKRFGEISETARNAMIEMSRLLTVLRKDTDAEEARAPQPGLGQVADLVDTARKAGTDVRLVMHGPPIDLSPGLDLIAYRIVQEALTNARRHAPGAAVDIELDYRPDRLHIQVRDNGSGTVQQNQTPGHGLIGMRDRATTAGGTLCFGPSTDGGFAIEAELPIEATT